MAIIYWSAIPLQFCRYLVYHEDLELAHIYPVVNETSNFSAPYLRVPYLYACNMVWGMKTYFNSFDMISGMLEWNSFRSLRIPASFNL